MMWESLTRHRNLKAFEVRSNVVILHFSPRDITSKSQWRGLNMTCWPKFGIGR